MLMMSVKLHPVLEYPTRFWNMFDFVLSERTQLYTDQTAGPSRVPHTCSKQNPCTCGAGLTVVVYLVCDWLPPGSCGCGCERPPSPQLSESPDSGDGGNAAAADSTYR